MPPATATDQHPKLRECTEQLGRLARRLVEVDQRIEELRFAAAVPLHDISRQLLEGKAPTIPITVKAELEQLATERSALEGALALGHREKLAIEQRLAEVETEKIKPKFREPWLAQIAAAEALLEQSQAVEAQVGEAHAAGLRHFFPPLLFSAQEIRSRIEQFKRDAERFGVSLSATPATKGSR